MPSEAAGDKARRAIEAQGLLYMPDVEEDVQRRLSLLELRSQVALAACCALRLMRLHRQLPLHRQREFTLTWGPTLDQVWEALVGDSAQLQILRVRRALDAFRVSPYNHSDGQRRAR